MDRQIRNWERSALAGDEDARRHLIQCHFSTGYTSPIIHISCCYSGRGNGGALHALGPFMDVGIKKHLCHGLHNIGKQETGWPTCKNCLKRIKEGRLTSPDPNAQIQYAGEGSPKMIFNSDRNVWESPYKKHQQELQQPNIYLVWRPSYKYNN